MSCREVTRIGGRRARIGTSGVAGATASFASLSRVESVEAADGVLSGLTFHPGTRNLSQAEIADLTSMLQGSIARDDGTHVLLRLTLYHYSNCSSCRSQMRSVFRKAYRVQSSNHHIHRPLVSSTSIATPKTPTKTLFKNPNTTLAWQGAGSAHPNRCRSPVFGSPSSGPSTHPGRSRSLIRPRTHVHCRYLCLSPPRAVYFPLGWFSREVVRLQVPPRPP